MQKTNWEKGTSLVLVMVGMAIFGIIAAAVATLMDFSLKSVKSVSQSGERNSLVNELQMVLASSETCNASNLIGMPFPGSSLPLSELKIGDVVWLSTSNSEANGIIVSSASIDKLSGPISNKTVAVAGVPTALELHQAALSVDIERTPGALGSSKFRRTQLKFFVYLNQSNKRIHSCFGAVEMASLETTCEVLLGGTYNPDPGVGQPYCTMKPAFKNYRQTGVRVTSFQGPMTFVNGTGTTVPWGAFLEYRIVAPDCPTKTVPVDCFLTMITQSGMEQELHSMSFDIDGGDPLMASNAAKISWYLAYLDQKNLDAESRPRCTLRIANATIDGTYTDWFPTVRCAAQTPNQLP